MRDRRREEQPPALDLYPARCAPTVSFSIDPITEEIYAASYNNSYEFSVFKEAAFTRAARLKTAPWQIDVAGLVEKPRVFDIDGACSRAASRWNRLTAFAASSGRWPCRGPASR